VSGLIPLKNLHGGASAHCRFPYSYTYSYTPISKNLETRELRVRVRVRVRAVGRLPNRIALFQQNQVSGVSGWNKWETVLLLLVATLSRIHLVD
jgi:hypothetical protein